MTDCDCKHHWIIESTNSSVAHGECALCGVSKVFTANTLEVWTQREQMTQMVNIARDNKAAMARIRKEREESN